jgi:hypothetical protein
MNVFPKICLLIAIWIEMIQSDALIGEQIPVRYIDGVMLGFLVLQPLKQRSHLRQHPRSREL